MIGKKFLLSFKSIGVFMLIIALHIQLCIPVTAADKAELDTAYLNKVELLEKLGIILDEDGMQYSEETVTRENFASILGVFYGVSRLKNNTAEGIGMFSDVSAKNPDCAVIETVVSAGAMDAYKDGRFRPKSNLSVEQAVKSMVVLLGYDVTVSFSGNGIEDYIRQGYKLELFSGIKTPVSKSITKGELVGLLCRALDTDIFQMTSTGDGKEYETVEKQTLLSETLGVYKIDGVLWATEITGIGKFDSCYKGYIIVDGQEIQTNEDMSEYLGMDLNVYCTDENSDGFKMIHFFGEENKNDTLTVTADDIEDAYGNTVFYEINGKTKKVRLSEDVTVIYNGKNHPLYNDDTFKITEGNIRFLDADKDGDYEIVFIKSYISFLVGQVYNDDGILTLIEKENPDKKYFIDTDNSNKQVCFKKNDTLATYEDINNKSVVSIAADKMNIKTKEILAEASYFEVLISDKTVSGVLASINDDEPKLMIDDVLYNVNRSFNLTSCDISPGDSAKFYLDAFGKVIVAEKGSDKLYGILDKAYADEDEENIAGIRIFSEDGAFKTFECAKNLNIDGKRYEYTDIEKIKTALETASDKFLLESGISSVGASEQFQLIRYSTNSDGQIVMIDTLVQNSTDTEIEKNYLNFSKKFDKNTRYFSKSYATTIDGGYIYDSNLIVFRLPNDKSKKEAYAKKSGLGSLGYEIITVPVYAFDANEFNYIPIMLAESDVTDNVPQKEDNNMMIFEKLTKELSEDGEVYNVLNGTSIKTGAAVKAYMQEEEYQQFISMGIKSGDIVRWSNDEVNTVTSIEHMLKNTGNESNIMLAGSAAGINATAFYSDFRVTCGTVEKFDDKYILFNLGTKQEASLKNPSAKVLVYNSKTKRTEAGDYSDIKTKEAFGTDASLIFTYQWFTAINTIVIFN